MAVNLSAIQLLEPDLVASVAEVLAATDTDPDLVTLEVTETVLVKDCDRTLRVLRRAEGARESCWRSTTSGWATPR